MLTALSLDPGITTGYCIAQITDTKIDIGCDEARMSHGALWKMMMELRPDFIVCETFEYRNRARDNLELFSREMIGIVRLYAELCPAELSMQSAAQGKGFYTDMKMKRDGIYAVGKKHGRDAVRHFMHWYTFGRGFEFNKSQPVVLS